MTQSTHTPLPRNAQARHWLAASAVAALLLLGAAGSRIAHAAEAGWTTFTDPTENAFTAQVPAQARVAGGIQRFSPTRAGRWLTVNYAGPTFMFVGDPAIPIFEEPNEAMRIMPGSWSVGRAGPVGVIPYQPGAEFAADYGQHKLATLCRGGHLVDRRPRPEVARAIWNRMQRNGGFMIPGTRIEAGIARFECQVNGRPFSASVTAATVLFPQQMGGGTWYVDTIFGESGPRDRTAETERGADMLNVGVRPNPRWAAAMSEAIQRRGEADRERDHAQASAFSARLRQQGDDLATTMAGRHEANMAMMDQQANDRTNRFNDHMRQKAWQQNETMMYINDEHCAVWDSAHTFCIKVHN